MTFTARLVSVALVLSTALLSGCATNGDPRDPIEPFNRAMYTFNDAVDKAVMKPVATGYKEVLPSPVRTAVGNFFSNLDDFLVVINDLLQFKFEQALSDFGRVFWNSTVGIAGLIDVATPMDMPKHNEDFGQTFGRWGIGSGPYIVLPFLGPSSVRDGVGTVVSYHLDPVYQHNNVAERNSAVVLRAVDKRASLLGTETILETAALDPYVFMRDAYLERRRNLVYDGNPPPEDDDDTPAAPPAK